jgi:hypothetical protein
MNNEPTRTQSLAGNLSAENAVGESAPPPAARPTPLRRWSVAELIARAVVARPADGISHG